MADSYSSPGAGWFPDPLGRHDHRYFNGTHWTADVSDGGQRFVDPLGTSPGPGHGGHPGAGSTGARNGVATAALVCGIIAVVIAWVPFIGLVGLVLAILALVFGIRGLRRSRTLQVGRGASIAGIVTGAIGLAAAVLGIVLSVALFRAVDRFASPGPVTAVVSSCDVDGQTAIVAGELTNSSGRTRDYTVFVTVDDRTEIFTLESIAPGDSVDWTATTRAPRFERDCDVEDVEVIVQGPFPFGVEIDPIDP